MNQTKIIHDDTLQLAKLVLFIESILVCLILYHYRYVLNRKNIFELFQSLSKKKEDKIQVKLNSSGNLDHSLEIIEEILKEKKFRCTD